MTPNQGRDREISRRETENMRAESIQFEMASAVRVLGGNGSALEQNNRAARAARLPVTVVERLRWRKIKRVPADIADTIREALEKQNEESLARAKHELQIARAHNASLIAQLEAVDAPFHRPTIAALRREAFELGSDDDFQGGA